MIFQLLNTKYLFLKPIQGGTIGGKYFLITLFFFFYPQLVLSKGSKKKSKKLNVRGRRHHYRYDGGPNNNQGHCGNLCIILLSISALILCISVAFLIYYIWIKRCNKNYRRKKDGSHRLSSSEHGWRPGHYYHNSQMIEPLDYNDNFGDYYSNVYPSALDQKSKRSSPPMSGQPPVPPPVYDIKMATTIQLPKRLRRASEIESRVIRSCTELGSDENSITGSNASGGGDNSDVSSVLSDSMDHHNEFFRDAYEQETEHLVASDLAKVLAYRVSQEK
ncbi:hypothetical protein G9A89_014255 [Geosiphon pyriformis]|nr:hypothetical protein G9A89_014255 [Geosiphon pyriformis]